MRHQHMMDLLRPQLNLEDTIFNFQHKSELTVEDYNLIIKNTDLVKKAAQIVMKDLHA